MKTFGENPHNAPRQRRSVFGAARKAGAAIVSVVAVVGAIPPQLAAAEPAPSSHAIVKHAPQQHWTQQEVTKALNQLLDKVRQTESKQSAGKHAKRDSKQQQALAKKALREQRTAAGAKTTLAGSQSVESDDLDDEDLPSDLNRGPGYDQIISLALQDPATANALHMMARLERKGAVAAAADPDDPDAGSGSDDPPSDPALRTVLSLNNGPILYQPPCPFGWPPPDRYGGLADIIELAPMAGDFVSEAFAPAAAWQPMAQLFGPLIAIIQPTIKQNRYWINPTIINVQNPINAIHFLFFGWYDVWHRQKFLQEEVEWANEVAPWLQQVYQTPQAACFVAFEGMFERLVETGQPWPRGWYVEDHATVWDIDKIGPYEPASPGSRPKALQDLDRELALEDGDGPNQNVPPAAPKSPPAAQQPKAPQVSPLRQETPPASPPPQEKAQPQTPPPQEEPTPPSSFPGIDAGVDVD